MSDITEPKLLPDGTRIVCTLPAGTEIKAIPGSNGCFVAVHPDHKPMIIYPSGHTETLEPGETVPVYVNPWRPFLMDPKP